MSRDRVTGQDYPKHEETFISQGRDKVPESGKLETEPARERRCTACGKRGHYRTSPVFHPVQVQAVRS